jgi:hypothetical protein
MVDDVQTEEDIIVRSDKDIPDIGDLISDEGLKYLAGYIAFVFKNKFPNLKEEYCIPCTDNASWLNFISRGHLAKPSQPLLAAVKKAETFFCDFHKPFINNQPGSITTILMQCYSVNDGIPEEVIRRFLSVRTHIKIKQINKQLRQSNAATGEKRKLVKKLKKVS